MRAEATYRIVGTGALTAAHVTRLLGVDPTSGREVGELVGNGGSGRRSDTAMWQLSTAPGGAGEPLGVAVNAVLEVLSPHASVLWALAGEGYVMGWFCFVEASSLGSVVALDRGTLSRLHELPGDLTLDVYPDDAVDAERRR